MSWVITNGTHYYAAVLGHCMMSKDLGHATKFLSRGGAVRAIDGLSGDSDAWDDFAVAQLSEVPHMPPCDTGGGSTWSDAIRSFHKDMDRISGIPPDMTASPRDSGHDNPSYNLPEGVTNIYQLVTQSRMTDDVGECFRLLYTYATDGKYAVPAPCKEVTDLARHFNFNGFMYDAMQALYRSGAGSRNTLERDMKKAQYYVHHEWRRLEDKGDYNELLEAAQDLMTDIVGKPYAD